MLLSADRFGINDAWPTASDIGDGSGARIDDLDLQDAGDQGSDRFNSPGRAAGAQLEGSGLSLDALRYAQVSPGWFTSLDPTPSEGAETTSQWIVRLSASAIDAIDRPKEAAATIDNPALGLSVERGLGLPGMMLVQATASASAVQAYLSSLSTLSYFGPNEQLSILNTPNDPSYGSLWGMNNTGQSSGTADADVDAPEAWDLTTGSSSIVVGVIDTGVDYSHPDLAANMWTNPFETAGNGIDDDGNGFVDDIHGYDFINNDGDPMDDHSHGTHCAGTIGASGNNGIGVVGVNWSTSIMALKFLGANGSGTGADAIRAINYATMMRQFHGVNVRVLSNSWGGDGFDQAMLEAIDASGNQGIMFVAAAGNSGISNDAVPFYPSSYNSPFLVSVAATDHNDSLAGFSNYGATSVDLAAPGVTIRSTTPGNGYGNKSGTSMATPQVAGIAALGWSFRPNVTVAQMKASLLAGVDSIATLSGKMVSGGRANALGTLNALAEIAPDIMLSNNTIQENAGVNAVVGALSATNGTAGETFTFSLPVGVNDNAEFNISGASLRANAWYDFEVRDTYSVTIIVADLTGNSFEKQFTISVTDVNDVPAAHSSSVTTDEDTTRMFDVLDFLFSDEEGDSLASIMLSGLGLASGDTLTVDQGSGPVTVTNGLTITSAEISSLTFTPAHDANGVARSLFDFTVNDADIGIVAATMSINVTAVNDGPIFSQSNYPFTINNRALIGSNVGVTPSTDPDAGDSLTYTIVDGNALGAFAIDAVTGRITIASPTKLPKIVSPATSVNAPVLTVQVSDGSLVDTATVTVTLNLAPQAMAPIAAAKVITFKLTENNAVAATAATLAGNAAYTGQLFANWTVSDTPGGSASSIFYVKSFTATGAVIGVNSKLSFEDQNNYTIYVTVSDSLDETKTVTTPVTLSITDVNEAPQLSLTDGLAGSPTFTFGTPIALVSKYTINEYTIATAGSTPKNGDVLFTLNANDDDQTSSSLVYAMTGTGVTNPSAGIFVDKTGALQFDAATGQVTVLNATKLDYEKFKTGIPLAFTVMDNGLPGSLPEATPKVLTSKATVTILLKDMNDAPTFKTPTLTVVKAENNLANVLVIKALATDGDTLDSVTSPLTYSLVSVLDGTGADVTSLFSINPTTGEIKVIAAKQFDFESTANKLFTLTVRATEDGTGLTTAQSVFGDQVITLNITDVNEAPTAVFTPVSGSPSAGTTGRVTVNLPDVSVGSTIGSLSITDPDILAALATYGSDTIVVTVLESSSTTAPAFAYVANTDTTTGGSLQVNNLTTLQSRVGKPFTVQFTIRDKNGLAGALSFTLTLTINVTDGSI